MDLRHRPVSHGHPKRRLDSHRGSSAPGSRAAAIVARRAARSGLLAAPAVRELPPDAAVEPLARAVRNRLLAGATPPVPALDSARYCLRLLERPGQRLRFLSGEYLTPSEAEYRALQLPPSLFFLYYPFRPVRLFWKHAIRRS